MSIWKEGRYKSNIKWVAQELFNGGVEKLLASLEPEDQVVKDDIVLMMNLLVMYLEDELKPQVSGAEYNYLEDTDIKAIFDALNEDELEQKPKKPHLYIVKNNEKNENNG
jgi:hypothetical protein